MLPTVSPNRRSWGRLSSAAWHGLLWYGLSVGHVRCARGSQVDVAVADPAALGDGFDAQPVERLAFEAKLHSVKTLSMLLSAISTAKKDQHAMFLANDTGGWVVTLGIPACCAAP